MGYTSEELRWECLTQERSESRPEGLESTTVLSATDVEEYGFPNMDLKGLVTAIGYRTDFVQTFKDAIAGYTDIKNADIAERFHISWLTMVGRELTRETDKLVAISGIVTEMQKATEDVFLAGLWQQFLWKDLLWCVSADGTVVIGSILYFTPSGPSSTSLSTLQMPTWAWASVTGHIKHIENEHESFKNHQRLVHILDIRMDSFTSQLTGHAVHGVLTLRGTVRQAKATSEERLRNEVRHIKTGVLV